MLATANTGKIGRGFGKNAGEYTGRVEISKEEVPGNKRSLYGETEKQRERDRETEKHRDIGRQRETETESQTDKDRARHRDLEKDR